MTTTFSFPKLAYGFALAATLVSGSTAHAWFGPPHISLPHRASRMSIRSPAGRHARLKAAFIFIKRTPRLVEIPRSPGNPRTPASPTVPITPATSRKAT